MAEFTEAAFTIQPPAEGLVQVKREESKEATPHFESHDTPSKASEILPSIDRDESRGSSTPAPPPSHPQKKKGTATVVKSGKPRSTSGVKKRGSTKGGRGGSQAGLNGKSSKLSHSTGSTPAPASDEHIDDDDTANDEESDHGPYCICRGPDDHRWMISCDICEDWFHGACVRIDKAVGDTLIQRYVCPNCTDPEKGNATRYRKACGLEGCLQAARIYGIEGKVKNEGGSENGDEGLSVFCCEAHAEQWWEELVGELPAEKGRGRRAGVLGQDDLSREKFVGLLASMSAYSGGLQTWRLGKQPFAVPSDFWSSSDARRILTPEEDAFLTSSAAQRYALAEEIVLNKSMQKLLDLANERRKAAVAAKATIVLPDGSEGTCEKDTCGYDFRLDIVGVPHEFALFAKSPQGEVILKDGDLSNEESWTAEQRAEMKILMGSGVDVEMTNGLTEHKLNPDTAGLCGRRRCKAHNGWYNTFSKQTKHMIKELARLAKEKLDAETRLKNAAASRHYRQTREKSLARDEPKAEKWEVG